MLTKSNIPSYFLLFFFQISYFQKSFQKHANSHTHIYTQPLGGAHGVMVKAMDCEIMVSVFVLQSCYYFHFWTNTLGKGMNLLILPAMS